MMSRNLLRRRGDGTVRLQATRPTHQHWQVSFFPLGATVGAKLFYDRKFARAAFANQQILWEWGLAPALKSDFMVIEWFDSDSERKQWWGYRTELLKPMTYSEFYTHRDLVTELTNEVNSCFDDRCFSDIAPRNFGWRGNYFLLIDTGF